jgi:hypothetical protein
MKLRRIISIDEIQRTPISYNYKTVFKGLPLIDHFRIYEILTNVHMIILDIFNKVIDIYFRALDTFLEYPSIGMLIVNRLESRII